MKQVRSQAQIQAVIDDAHTVLNDQNASEEDCIYAEAIITFYDWVTGISDEEPFSDGTE